MARTHHYCSPSRLERVEVCPGSLRMEAMSPEEPSGPDAEEGEMLHEHVPPHMHLDKLKPEHRDLVERCRAVVDTLIAEADGDVGGVEYEQKLKLVDDAGETVSSGYVDVIIDHPKANLVTVLDWKFGRTEVTPAEHNKQVQGYGLMGAQRRNRGRMRAGVFSPRLMGNKPDLHTWDDLFLPLTQILAVIESAYQEELTLCSRADTCRYCAARLTCPAVKEKEAIIATNQFSEGVTVEELVKAYDAWQTIKRRGYYVEDLFKSAVESGQVPGWEIKQRSGGREFKDANAAYNALLAHFPSPAEFLQFVTVSVAQVEEYVSRLLYNGAKEAGKKLTLANATKQFREQIAELVVEKPPVRFAAKTKEAKAKGDTKNDATVDVAAAGTPELES